MSFSLNTASVFTTRMLNIAIGFIASVIVTRILGPHFRGVMEILVLVPFLFVNFGNLGIGNANLYFIGQKKRSFGDIVSNSLSVSLWLGLILMFLAYVFYHMYKDSIFAGVDSSYTHLVFTLIPPLLFQKYIQYTFLGEEEIRIRNILVLAPVLLNFSMVIILVVIYRLHLMGVLVATLVSNLFAVALCFFYVSKKTKIKFGFDFTLFLESVKFGMIPFLALLIINLNLKADLFLVKYYLENTAVGLYSLAVSVVSKINMLPQAIGLVLFSKVANITDSEANFLTPVVCRMSVFCSIVGGILLFATAHILIPLVYGKDFISSVQPLLILIPGIIFLTFFVVLHSDFAGRGKAGITLFIFSIAFILNIVLNIYLIPRYGINGAAAASTLSYSLGALWLTKAFSKHNKIPLKTLLFPTRQDFTIYILPWIGRMKSKLVY